MSHFGHLIVFLFQESQASLDSKAEKIKLALLKMKEANIKKVHRQNSNHLQLIFFFVKNTKWPLPAVYFCQCRK